MASIQKRGSTYRARVIRRGYPTQSKTFNTRLEAVKWARNIESKIDEGHFESNSMRSKRMLDQSMPFSDAVNRYIETHSIHKKNYRSETGIFKTLIKRWEDKTVFEVNKHAVTLLRDDLVKLGRSGDTINHYFNAISKLYQMLADELSVDIANPIKAIKRMPSNPGRNVRLTGEAEALFISCCQQTKPNDLADLVQFAIETGMRRGELLGIRWSDIDLEHRRIYLHTTKNGESRQVPLTIKAIQIIKNIRQREPQSETLFTCSTPALRKGFHKARQMAKDLWIGIGKNPFSDWKFHDTRHEALSRLSDAGLNAIELAHISGHKTMACLRRYTHPSHEAIFIKLDKHTEKK
jgi:integrase